MLKIKPFNITAGEDAKTRINNIIKYKKLSLN